MTNRTAFTFTGLILAFASKGSFLGAEIRYAPVIGVSSTYTITVDVYRDLSNGDVPEITLDFGDGQTGTVPRMALQDFSDVIGCGSVRLSTYRTEHLYSGPGIYSIRYEGGGRGGGIVNIPNSIAQGVCIEAILIIDPALEANTSIAFASLQFGWQQNWNTWLHETTPQEPDGDSLTFELTSPMGDGCQAIPGYTADLAANYIWLDPVTGTLLWDYPPAWGTYTFAIRASEWRNGQLIGQVTRDMSVCVAGVIAGIEVPIAYEAVTLGPNLSSDFINIQNKTDGPLRLDLFAVGGAIVHSEHSNPGSSSLSLATFAPGIYTANFSDTHGVVIHRTKVLKP